MNEKRDKIGAHEWDKVALKQTNVCCKLCCNKDSVPSLRALGLVLNIDLLDNPQNTNNDKDTVGNVIV